MLVNLKKPSTMDADGVKLIPGVNKVDAKEWARARKHPMVALLMDEGVIVEESEMKDGQEPDVSDMDALKGMKEAQAKSLIEETVDLELLKGWLKGEERKNVKAALEKQIKKLEAPTEYKESGKVRQVSAGVKPIEMNAGDFSAEGKGE